MSIRPSRLLPNLAAALLIVSALPGAAAAQATERAEVMAVVTKLFDAMRKSDSAAARSVFHPKATLITATPGRNPATSQQIESIDGIVRAIGSPKTIVWDERLYNEKVEVDGALASVWVEYSFFAGPNFSHCGIDAIQLVKMPDGWKITALADTRRQSGCRTY